uniref:Uncharacterized protein n=1 Tax=Heterorhabditis bacteriophora TaxID=37862 RepID=A0A1I7X2A9_HETBA
MFFLNISTIYFLYDCDFSL